MIIASITTVTITKSNARFETIILLSLMYDSIISTHFVEYPHCEISIEVWWLRSKPELSAR